MRCIGIIVLLVLTPVAGARGAEPLAVWLRQVGTPPSEHGGGGASVVLAPPSPELVAAGEVLVATLRTSRGNIVCQLAHEAAPYSVRTFVELARGVREWVDPRSGARVQRPLYDGTLFHRVVPGFLVQGGDPGGTGTGGPGFAYPDEIAGDAVFDRAGVLGLANRGPNTNGSQFFVTAGPAHHLDGRYTRLGLCGDLDVIEQIAGVPRGEGNRPVEPVVLRSVEIVARRR
ncbi:MAG: peptidylprolyl isomerase [Myxococcales bacterium]|nr:peptidylprolyl isomerase [Myxococcales bacterium]